MGDSICFASCKRNWQDGYKAIIEVIELEQIFHAFSKHETNFDIKLLTSSTCHTFSNGHWSNFDLLILKTNTNTNTRKNYWSSVNMGIDYWSLLYKAAIGIAYANSPNY